MTTVRHLAVVGASGFLGRALARAADARGLPLTAVDRELRALEQAAAPGTVVVNAAGRVEAGDDELRAAHVELPRRLGRRCLELGLPLLHVGSAAEYGPPQGDLAREDDPEQPVSPYGVSKLAGCRALQELAQEGLRVTVARVFNVVGGYDERIDPISEFAAVIQGNPSPVDLPVRDPSLVRDFAGVDWVADRLVDLAAHAGTHAVVNVCTGRGTSFAELIEAMAQSSGKQVRVTSTAPGGLARVVGDPSRLRALLGDAAEPEPLSELARVALTPSAGLTSARRG